MPDYWVQVIETYFSTHNTDIGMEGKNKVATKFASCDADVSNDAYQSPSRDKNSIDVPPDFAKLNKEFFIVLNVAKLVRDLVISFKIPVGWRGDDKMD